jgi:hypothetical protein
MSLYHLSQPALERSVEILINNGGLPQAQNTIASVGYDIGSLQRAVNLLNTWRDGLIQAQSLLTAQKRATQAQHEARSAAQKEVSLFGRTVRTLFSHDETVLRSLGLHTPRRTNGNGDANGAAENGQNGANGSELYAPRASKSATATIVRWRRMFANAQNLAEDQRARLANAGWPAERITSAAVLVEAFAQANTRHQEAMQAYQAQSNANKDAELELRGWYKEARQLIRLAIEQVDPDDKERLRQLLTL